MNEEMKALMAGLQQKNSDLLTNIATLQNEVKSFGSGQAETKTNIDRILAEEEKMRDDLKALQMKFEGAYSDGGRGEHKSAGAKFVESARFKAMREAGGNISGPVSMKSFAAEFKDITSSTTNAAGSVGAGLPNAGRMGLIAPDKIELRVRDLLNVVPTTLTSMEYVKYTFTNNAAIVYDAGASGNKREGVTKPKSDMQMTKANATAETIAHWVAASKQILADINGLRGVIDTELLYGLKLEEENEILNGDGTAGHLNGLMNQAATLDYELLGAAPTKIDKIRAAILQARLALYPVTGIILNPQDWFDIETAKDTLGRYIIGDPQGMAAPRLWGKPVVESDSMTYDDFLVGAFRMGATLFDREEANIESRDTHASFFIQNMIAIRAEERVMLVVPRPQAFVKGPFTEA